MQEVEKFLLKYVPNFQKESFVLAVSGGVDSMVLLEVFLQLRKKYETVKISVVHIHHHLRKESDDEEKMVRDFCKENNVAVEVYHWYEGSLETSGIEEKARMFRYQKFEEVMKKNNSAYLVVAHHADDQAETVLMKLARGSTLEGIAGMKSVRIFGDGFLIRPFLTLDKKTLYEFAFHHQVPYMEDGSNQSLSYTRNRFRKEIIPLFKNENPKFTQKIQKFTELLQEQQEVISSIVQQWMSEEMLEIENGWLWNRENFIKQSDALQKFILIEISKKLGGIFSTKNVREIQNGILSNTPQMDLNITSEWIFQKRYHHLSIINEKNKMIPYQEIRVETATAKDIQLSDNEILSFTAEVGWEMFVSSKDFPLTIRRKKPNDRFSLNVTQHQSVRRWCINQKIPRELREKLWIVENSSKEIIAILGFRKTQLLSKMKETDKIRLVYRKEEVQTC